jgi:transposase
VTLHYDGYSNAEIAELTNAVSEKAIEGVLARWRKREQILRSEDDSHG